VAFFYRNVADYKHTEHVTCSTILDNKYLYIL